MTAEAIHPIATLNILHCVMRSQQTSHSKHAIQVWVVAKISRLSVMTAATIHPIATLNILRCVIRSLQTSHSKHTLLDWVITYINA